MKKILFTARKPLEFLNTHKIFNFLNLESLWNYKNNYIYSELISQKHNINFPDGRIIGLFLNMPQQRGPTFTKEFLMSNKAKGKKHFFIGNATMEEIHKVTNIPRNKIDTHNPPYIKRIEFSQKERDKIISLLKKLNPDFIWVCVGSPKQEILSNQLYKKFKGNYFNIGAGLDFLLKKKIEASDVWRKLGLEWAHRGITDFKHSRKKNNKKFIGIKISKIN